MLRAGWVAVAVVLCACGDDKPRGVEFCAYGETIAVYRDGDGPWQTAVVDERGRYVLNVADDFEFTVVRGEPGSFLWLTSRSTVDEWLASPSGMRAECEALASERVAVTGELAQAGEVWIDNHGHALSGPGMFTISVGPGVHDLIATTGNISEPGRVLVRREQSFDAPTTVPLIDIDAEGSELVSVPIAVSGLLGSETLTTDVWTYDPRNGDVVVVSRRDGATAGVVPAALLGTNQQQSISISSGSHGVEIRKIDDPPAVELLPPLEGITFARTDGVTASWESFPVVTYDFVQLSIVGRSTTASLHQSMFATRGWMERHASTSISFDSNIPGVDPSWRLDTTMMFNASLSLMIDTEDISRWTCASTDETTTPRVVPRMGAPFEAPRAWRLAH